MPLVSFNDKSDWDAAYSIVINGEELHYERRAKEYVMGPTADLLRAALESLGLQRTDRIAFIGCGFAWTGESFAAAGYTNIVNVDKSDWINSSKQEHAVLPILNADVLTQEGLALVGTADWAVSEDILPCYTDEEALALSTAMRLIAPNVVHMTSTKDVGSAQGYNWKTLEEWKTLLSPDYLTRRCSDVVL